MAFAKAKVWRSQNLRFCVRVEVGCFCCTKASRTGPESQGVAHLYPERSSGHFRFAKVSEAKVCVPGTSFW